ncbi:MAG: hypothetical protein SO170_02475 [Butyribacter sp.]|nr:hypothetical protein [bacterium]MDY3853820.1 hypothetical protein [Butyribacter sp.]
MSFSETEETTGLVLQRMENSLNALEQMSFDSINITDKLVMKIDEIRECADNIKTCQGQGDECMLGLISDFLQELLNVAFEVNNVSHELEKETVYQRETLENLKQIVGFLYAMTDN